MGYLGVKIPNQRQADVLLMMKIMRSETMIFTKDKEYTGKHPDLNGSQALRLQMHSDRETK